MITFAGKTQGSNLENHLPTEPVTPRDLAGITQSSHFSRYQGPDSAPSWMKDI